MRAADHPHPSESGGSAALGVLATGVEAVLDLDLDSLDAEGLHEAVVAMRRLASRFDAAEARLIDRWDQDRVWATDGSRSGGARLGRDARCDPNTANRVLRRARKLRSMPTTRAAHRSGDLSSDHVDGLCRANREPVCDLFARDEADLIGHATGLGFRDFLKALAYWSQLADDDTTEDRARKHHKDRWFRAARTLGGIDLQGALDPIDGEIVRAELARLEQELFDTDWAEARNRLGDAACEADLRRSTDQRRADALVRMAQRSAVIASGSTATRPLITVLIDLPTLLGRVCELADGTVITPGQVASIIDGADLERVIFGAESRVLDVGVRRRFFTGATKRAIQLRDRTCQFPGCDRPASECQIDHVTEWHRGGPTTQTNGRLLCPAHNRQRPGNPSPSGNPGPDQGGPRSNQNTGPRTRGDQSGDTDDDGTEDA